MLQTIQVLTDARDIGSLDALCDAVGTGMEQGLEALLKFSARRVVEKSKLPLDVLEASGELRVLDDPSLTEPGIGLEFRDAMPGCGDAAIELVEGRLRVVEPVPLRERLGTSG